MHKVSSLCSSPCFVYNMCRARCPAFACLPLCCADKPSDKQKTHPNPLGFEYELFGGELGTRTPDPLRVMHDDFSFFRTMIRQIEAICYRSATNSSFHLPQSRTNSEVISSNLLLIISPYCSYPTNTELSTSQIWFRPIACTASIAASLWLKCRFPTVRQFAPSNVSCC